MARQGMFDDSGYMGFEECAKHEACCMEAESAIMEKFMDKAYTILRDDDEKCGYLTYGDLMDIRDEVLGRKRNK